MKYNQLRELIATKQERMVALSKEAEARALTAAEKTEFDTLETEVRELEADARRTKTAEDAAAQLAARSAAGGSVNAGPSAGDKRDMSKFSMIRAIGSLMPSAAPLDGVELEMHKEAVKEARDSGLAINGVGIPSVMLGISRRDMTATGGTAGDQGGTTIATDLSSDFVGLLYNRLGLKTMGARMLTGLTGNLDFAKQATGATSSWGAENATLSESSPTTGKTSLTPHRLGTTVDISKQLLIQSSFAVEMMVREDLAMSVAQAVDTAGINGSGSSSQPTGLLNWSGIGSVAMGTNGGDPTWAKIVALLKAVQVANADFGKLGYLTNPQVIAKLMTTVKDSNTAGIYLMNEGTNEQGVGNLAGYRIGNSNNVPATLTKGSSSGVCSALIFGNFNDLLIGQWGGLDLTADPYTKAKEGQIVLTIDSFWDVFVRRAASFAAIKDLTTV